MEMMVREILSVTGGTLLCGDETTVVTSVSIDSRDIRPGALFVPIRGAKTDAHAYIPAVFEKGAAATLTQNHSEAQGTGAWIHVPDTTAALQQIAAAYRNRFTMPVIGITGSVGKTTTKEMVALALSSQLDVMWTKGNFNSQVGLPLTMFQMETKNQAAVIEMGMSDFGEMQRLAKIARPCCAVITNIGISHIEQLKTQQNIRMEKLHITDSFTGQSVLFLNGDDPLLAELKGTLPFRCVYFGTQAWCDYRACRMETDSRGTSFYLQAQDTAVRAFLPAWGEHNVLNALAAVAVADYLGLNHKKTIRALAEYQAPAMRQQIHKGNGITVIDDSYNASPDSVKSSIAILKDLKKQGRAIAVLADMLELGDYSEQAHFDVGVCAAKAGVDFLVAVGEKAKGILKGASSISADFSGVACNDNQQALSVLKEYLRPGDIVLVKGSRGMHTDEIVTALLQ